MTENKPTLSVIMPALNEEANVAQAMSDTLAAFDAFGIKGELILVNDGSTDRTPQIVAEAMQRDGRVRTTSHATPHGIGASFWDGVDLATGETVCMFPSDNEIDPMEALRYFDLLDHVDMVVPFVYNTQARNFFRNALSFLYRLIINTTFLVNFNYTNGTVLYRRSILKQLEYRSKGFFFQTDILVRTSRRGYLFAEVPYRLVGMRASGKSKAVTYRSLMNVMREYMRLVRDTYFRKESPQLRQLTSDSQSAKRRSEHE